MLFISLSVVANAKDIKVKTNKNSNYVADIQTSKGNIKIVLLNETPLHLENFLKNIDSKLYNNMKFHRVIRKFVIQTGDLGTKDESYPRSKWGEGGLKEKVKPEFTPKAVHTIGAVGMARESDKENPERLSSASHFYIVQGKNKLTNKQIDIAEQKSGFTYTQKQRQSYLRDGGQPRLDGAYVVFGYVIEGMNVVDDIALTPKNKRDVPYQNIVINKIKVKKINKKTLEKKYSYYAN